MPEQYYKEALRQGQKAYRTCIARGEYPYLPVLDELLPKEHLSTGKDIGICQIPSEWIVGTRSAGRSNIFTRGFLPLAPEDSEFASKWQSLCVSHLEEGIRDPIKAYEYLNRYYVEEGNKRVSVLKYFGAPTVYAQVIRILPGQTGTPEVERYYELVRFYSASGINSIEFTKSGSCAKLQQLLGKAPDERWTEEERRAFSTTLYLFRQTYEAEGGKKLNTTLGDALLACMQVYGWQAIRNGTAGDLKKMIAKTWEEIALQQESSPIDVKLNPEEEKPESLLSRVLPKVEKPLKVAFIHDKDPMYSGWTNGHEQGREYAQRVFGGEIETTAYYWALDGDPYAVMEKAVADGNTVIFATSPRLLPASLRVAVDHPKLTIMTCSLNQSHRYIRTYYARMFEAKFISGIIAGTLSGTDSVGYICDYPIFGQVACINAFALGAQTVNPRIRVYLEWSSVGGLSAATERLTKRGIRLISSQDLSRLRDDGRSPMGLSIVTENGQVQLASPVWQWGVYYESLLRRVQDKSLQTEYAESHKALNYYWGMSAGVVEMRYSDKIPDCTRKLADLVQRSLCAGLCRPFRGPLYDQKGRMVLGADQELTSQQIIEMNWLNENVVGTVPAYDDLTEIGKATVDMVGIAESLKQERG